MGFNAVLMEYEDMFPFDEELASLARKTAYSRATIEEFGKAANATGLELIPLVQTFGHMEFALKHSAFAQLREDPSWSDTICPSNNRSIWLIRQIISQVRRLHPRANAIHIGADEAWHVARDSLCKHRLEEALHGSMDRLKLEHISKIATIAREEFGFGQVFAWNDMFDKIAVKLLQEYGWANC